MVDVRELKRRVKKKIDSLLSNSSSDQHSHVVGRYYPADAGKCIRRTFFKYKFGVSSDVKYKAKGRILTSEILENLYLDILESMGYSIKVKVSKKVDGIEIRGEVDAMNDEEVVDVKTVTPTAINRTPFPADIAQLNTYLWITDRPVGTLIYVKSDNPAIMEAFPISYSPKMLEETLNRLKTLHEHLVTNKIPPKISNKDVCKNCMFRNVCSYIDQLF